MTSRPSSKKSQKKQGRLIPASIRAFFYDFDGVLTDNRVWVLSDGSEAVACHRGDGWAIGRLRQAGFFQCIISTEENPVVSRRAEKLKIPCLQGCANKRAALIRYAVENGINLAHAAYVGNDENDLAAMSLVGFQIAPADAAEKVRRGADLVTRAAGGFGVIRELMDQLDIEEFLEKEEDVPK